MKKSTFEMSYAFSDLLTEKNLQAVAHSNGVLNQLVQAASPVADSYVADLAKGEDDPYLANVAFLFSDNTVSESTGYPGASITLVDQTAPLVAAHISHARNVVKPLVVSLAKSYIEYLETNRVKEASSLFEIKKTQLPSILTDQSFISDLGWARDAKRQIPNEFLRVPQQPESDLKEYCLIGSSSLDKQIKQWLESKEDGWLETIWYGVFGQTEYLPANVVSPGYYGCEMQETPHAAAEYCLAVYLLARKLQMNVPEGVSMSLAKYDQLVTAIKDYAAFNLVTNLQKVATLNSTKTLVVYLNEGNYCLTVNGDLYGAWLDEGNCPEILLGMVSGGDIKKTTFEINENADKYKRAWERFSSLYIAKETNNLHIYARKAVLAMFHQQLQETAPEEAEVRSKEANFVENRVKAAEEYLEGLTVKHLEDAHLVALYLVGKIRFDYTSAYYILTDIDEVGKANPDIDPREAAMLATVNYIGDFLADQIALKTN